LIFKEPDKKKFVIFGSIVFYIFTSLLFLYYGKIHVDEPYYFTIANLVNEGAQPYKDFFYTQPPLFPYVYAIPQRIFGPNLYVGRLTSIFLGLLSLLILIEFCCKIKSSRSAAIASLLVGFNPFLIYHLTFVKLYSLLTFFLILGVRILFSDLKDNIKYPLVSAIFTLSVLTRITTLSALIVIILYLIFVKRDFKSALSSFVVSIALAILVFVPFIIKAKDQMLYGMWGYLMDRDVLPLSGIFKAKVLFLSEFSRHFGLFLILLVLVALHRYFKDGFKRVLKKENFNLDTLCWMVLLFLALPHLLTKISYVSEYLSFMMPFLAILLGVSLSDFVDFIGSREMRVVMVAVFITASFLTWFSNFPEFIMRKNGMPPVRYLSQVAEYLKGITERDSLILSFNNAIVVLADRKIVPGYEMNSCTFDPEWGEERCKKHRIVNAGMLSKIIKERKAGAILITKNTFLGNFPSFYNITGKEVVRDTLMPLIERYYVLKKIFPEFGNMSEDAYLYVPQDGIR